MSKDVRFEHLERRSAPRRSHLDGTMVTRGGGAIPCRIPDWSDLGARLEVESTRDIPDGFVLNMPDQARPVVARVQWREPTMLGVAFDPAGVV